jgi:hypothetical protein
LTDGADKEKFSSTSAFNDEPRRRCEDAIHYHVHTTQEKGHLLGGPDGVLKKEGKEVDDGVAALSSS